MNNLPWHSMTGGLDSDYVIGRNYSLVHLYKCMVGCFKRRGNYPDKVVQPKGRLWKGLVVLKFPFLRLLLHADSESSYGEEKMQWRPCKHSRGAKTNINSILVLYNTKIDLCHVIGGSCITWYWTILNVALFKSLTWNVIKSLTWNAANLVHVHVCLLFMYNVYEVHMYMPGCTCNCFLIIQAKHGPNHWPWRVKSVCFSPVWTNFTLTMAYYLTRISVGVLPRCQNETFHLMKRFLSGP